eukprot:6473942-Amphidinium_carterae.1
MFLKKVLEGAGQTDVNDETPPQPGPQDFADAVTETCFSFLKELDITSDEAFLSVEAEVIKGLGRLVLLFDHVFTLPQRARARSSAIECETTCALRRSRTLASLAYPSRNTWVEEGVVHTAGGGRCEHT